MTKEAPAGRLARWALQLMEYDFNIVHRPGRLHIVPDALSRQPQFPKAIPSNTTSEQVQSTQFPNRGQMDSNITELGNWPVFNHSDISSESSLDTELPLQKPPTLQVHPSRQNSILSAAIIPIYNNRYTST